MVEVHKRCEEARSIRVYSQTQKAGTFGKSCPYPDKYREQEKCNEEECILPDFVKVDGKSPNLAVRNVAVGRRPGRFS